jgi:hypothetical protein
MRALFDQLKDPYAVNIPSEHLVAGEIIVLIK